MTGEFFGLLSEKSILSASVQKGNRFTGKQNRKYFREGVLTGSHSNLLHAAFLVRTNQLFKKHPAEANYFYLSGLLIGYELGELSRNKKNSVTLVASGKMKGLYLAAFKVLGIKKENKFRMEDADRALVKGQWKIWNHFRNRSY
jgi:2-dehydro-3-deoxygalactonokinase